MAELTDPGILRETVREKYAAQFEQTIAAAGLGLVEIRETHRVHEHAAAAIIRASKPTRGACCEPAVLEACCAPTEKADCCGSSDGAPSSCGCQDAA